MPTREAEILYPRALAILHDMEKLEEEIAMAGQTVSGELVIGASTIPGAYLLPSIASSFKERYPGISFEIRIDDSAKIVQAILANDLFLGIVGAQIPARKITYRPFTQDELILVCAGKREMPNRITPEYLLELPFISREHGSGTRKNIENFLAEQKINADQLNIVAMLGSSTAVKEAVKADLGVSIISRHALQDELKAGSVREIDIHNLTMRRTFYIATASKRTLPHHYQAFLNSLLTGAKEG